MTDNRLFLDTHSHVTNESSASLLGDQPQRRKRHDYCRFLFAQAILLCIYTALLFVFVDTDSACPNLVYCKRNLTVEVCIHMF